MPSTHFRTCNLCEALCGLEIKTNGTEILSIKGDPADPLSRGHICPKAVALQDIYRDPNRLKTPVRRTANGWDPISWDEAFDRTAEGLRAVQARHGNNAIGAYLGNPNVHNLGSMLLLSPLIRALRTRNRFSATSADQLPHHFASRFMLGHYFLLPVPDIDRTGFLLMLGANPLVSNGSLMTAPDIGKRLRAIQERGGKVIVIDPRRTETAGRADEHFFIRPGTDALLLAAILHTLYRDKRIHPGHLAPFTDGIDTLGELITGFPPERVASLTGIPAPAIRRLAREFAAAPAAVAYGRIGLSTQAFGGLCQWLINAINIVTGNFDRPGGAMFTRPAIDMVAQSGQAGKTGTFGRWRSRVGSYPEFAGELPVAILGDEILTPGEGQIRGLLTVAGNPVLSTPNGNRLDQAFSQLEFMAAIDIYINETTRHADIILPPATGLETAHYDIFFHTLAIRNTAKYSPPLVPKDDEQRYDWEIFQALTERLSGKPSNGMTPEQMLAMGLQFGPYAKEGLSLEKLKNNPHGIDLGPLRPCLPERLFTENRRINLCPPEIISDLPRLEKSLVDNPASPAGRRQLPTDNRQLLLIGRRELRSNNSWMHNSERLIKGPRRCTLRLHPDDAQHLGITEGQPVTVQSRTGAITLPAEITDEMMPGVVSIPHGYGHQRPGVRLDVATQRAGASINDLTDHQFLDELTGNAAFSGVPVRITIN